MLLPDELNREKNFYVIAFDMIIAITPPDSRSNFFYTCNCEKLVLNVLLMFLIRIFLAFLLASLLVVTILIFIFKAVRTEISR